MADKFSKGKRSEIMSKISGKDTKPEVLVRKYLFAKGFRYRKNDKRLPGKPDIVLPKYRTVVFIHGCFWHGHEGCKKANLPASNEQFWNEKISGNRSRDEANTAKLLDDGWNIITVWQCEISNSKKADLKLSELAETILNCNQPK